MDHDGLRPRHTSAQRSSSASGTSSRRLRKPQPTTTSERIIDAAERAFDRDHPTDGITRRKAIQVLLGIGLGAGVFQLAMHQVVYGDVNRQRADARRLLSQTIYAKRGTFYDRNGNAIASSVECENVAVNPQQIKDARAVVAALVDVLGVDEKTARSCVEADGTWVYVKRQVDEDDAEKLRKKALPGIEFEQTVKRIYPFGQLASQVLGVVSVENKGISGLEMQYEDTLSGTNGWIVRERAADGSYIAGGAYRKSPATNGHDVVLTLDMDIQRVAEEALAEAVSSSGAKYGSVIVTIPATGEILAACSCPTFDPANLSQARTEDMNLRVVTDAYEPGSVFKPLVCSMGIDLGLITPDTEFSVPAKVKVGSDWVQDVDNRDYTMTMSVREIVRRSSNTGMALVGEEIGADNFASYLDKYHFGNQTGIDFPGESTGIVKKRSEYDGASVGSMSFGQSIALPPVEVMRAMSAISNKGVMTVPHFLKSYEGDERDWSKENVKVVSEQTASEVTDIMVTVVKEGTGTAGAVEGYEVAGKTGTAQRATEGGYEKGVYMASFMGFAPARDPQVQVYVTLDGTPYNSYAASKPFATIMRAALLALGVKPQTSTS